jgi:S-adenosylmethionine:tRNA ribosyltransferase-isomerase
VKTALFDYELPERLIAQKPADRRDQSRLLVVDRAKHAVEHRHFADLPEYLRPGDCLFRNNAGVIPARLHAHRPTGGDVECLLLRPARAGAQVSGLSPQVSADSALHPPPSALHPPPSEEWWCLLRPGRKLPVGAEFGLAGFFNATVREKFPDGTARVAFGTAGQDILAVANRIGEMPLPPYIGERHSEDERALDRERYQTVYADRGHQVAAAAPTAGLHFTTELLARLTAQDVATADLTLHVGLGTFRPITSAHIEDHPIHREVYEIPAAARRALRETKGRRIAVGTTSVRSIEDYLAKASDPTTAPARRVDVHSPQPWVDEAAIFIHPPATFRGVDALITNFHQPRSTLLCLVSAFLAPGSTDGIAWLKDIYAEAVSRQYRFFSYGDAMLIL